MSDHPLSGQTIEFGVAGAADWPANRIAADLLPGFMSFARDRFGYEVKLHTDLAPGAALFDRTLAAFSDKTSPTTLFMIDNAWLDAFAARKLIAPLNAAIQATPGLDVAWADPVIRSAVQLFPSDSNNRWAMPQSGDVLALYIRNDLLTAPGEADAFRARYGVDLPQNAASFETLTWEEYGRIFAFFTRPEHELFGLGSHWSSEEIGVSAPAASFMLGSGGELWDAKTGQIEGVLDTEGNAAALAAYKALLAFQPPDALSFGTAGLTAAFTKGRLFAALQWTGVGAEMIPSAASERVFVVPAPAFPNTVRRYILGGQSWVISAECDEAHRRVALDLLAWWFTPETMLEFARRGGSPCDEATLSRPDFNALQPWFRAYRAMLPDAGLLWRDPHFYSLLDVQQEVLTAYMTGKVTDPHHALSVAACRQQALLFNQGTAERQPADRCASLSL